LGLKIANTEQESKRKLLLGLSLVFNLGMLSVFKYYNFFIESFESVSAFFGLTFNLITINIILPIGISFYTFQTLSYTIDVYRRQITPSTDIIAFFTFVSFFPQLVAGPIERAKNLLPQFYNRHSFDYAKAVDGTRQILWGFFKKVVIADNCALYVDAIFNNYANYSSLTLIVGTVLFAFQIYCDFSGYSDIAIGTAKLLGFNLKQNFAFPYFSRDIAEFWRRWHISLSTWFRDYLYIPLGGSMVTKPKVMRNIIIIFVVSGFWHGANWTFIVWGFLNALYFLPQWLRNTNRRFLRTVAENRILPSIAEVINITTTFTLTCIAWVFFRAKNVTEAVEYIIDIFSFRFSSTANITKAVGDTYLKFTLPVAIFILINFEWYNRAEQHGLSKKSKYSFVRWSIYVLLVLAIIQYFGTEQSFIYFQF